MDDKLQIAVENYQCAGCVNGSFPECYKKHAWGSGCDNHAAGTYLSGIGKIFLGLPKGFNRLGPNAQTRVVIYEKFEDDLYDQWNIPTWKFLDEHGNTLVRVLSPRTNFSAVHVILEDCMDKIKCQKVTKQMHEFMD